jgi:hypothetical protein
MHLLHRYEGEWSAAMYEGHGSETFAKGSTYHGQYAAGLRHGWGCCRFFNGDFYEGQWAKGLREGCGMQQVSDFGVCCFDASFFGGRSACLLRACAYEGTYHMPNMPQLER